jgi:hypothetical protein
VVWPRGKGVRQEMKLIIGFIAGAVFMFIIVGMPNIIWLYQSVRYQEIISQTADEWFVEGYNTAMQQYWGSGPEVKE